MRNLSSALKIEKNKLASPYPWVPLFFFAFPAPTGNIYLVGNTSDVTFSGQAYTAFDISVQFPQDAIMGQISECTIIAANQSQVFEQMIIDTGGGVDTQVTIRIVNTNNLTEDYSDLTWTFYLLQVTCDQNAVTMQCGLYSALDKKFPPDRYFSNTCRYKVFKSLECQANVSQTTCDRSYTTCVSYGNQQNFGGFMGIIQPNIAFLFTKKV